jgi:hypothetical protein
MPDFRPLDTRKTFWVLYDPADELSEDERRFIRQLFKVLREQRYRLPFELLVADGREARTNLKRVD